MISCLWQALYASAFGIFVAVIYLHSGNLVLCMVIHTVWDILELGIFPIVAIVICVKYKGNKNSEAIVEISETE